MERGCIIRDEKRFDLFAPLPSAAPRPAPAATFAAASVTPTTSTSVDPTTSTSTSASVRRHARSRLRRSPSITGTAVPAASPNAAASVGATSTALAPSTTTACAPEGSQRHGSERARPVSECEAGLSAAARRAGWCPVVLRLCFGSHSAMNAWRMCCLRKSVTVGDAKRTAATRAARLRHILLPAFASASRASLCCKQAPWLLGEVLMEQEARKDNTMLTRSRHSRVVMKCKSPHPKTLHDYRSKTNNRRLPVNYIRT